LWLHAKNADGQHSMAPPAISDLSVYWAASGWDLKMLLEAEAPLEVLERFVRDNPRAEELRLVRYALAVRLAREDRYEEAAEIYGSIGAVRRAGRMRRMAELYAEANRDGLDVEHRAAARYALAEFLSANTDRIYFNDSLWYGLQRYALQGGADVRLTKPERERRVGQERKLKDGQEERWRAYLLLREVVRETGDAAMRRKAAELALRCLRRMSERFGREEEIRRADLEMSRWVRG
jgi:hypothetical protein